MRFWKYVKDLISMSSGEQNQNDSSTSDSFEEPSDEMSNQSQQPGGEQSQSDSSTSDSSEEQSDEMENQPQQPGDEQNQDGSSTSNSFEEPSDEMSNQPQQPGEEQNENDSSTSDSFEEPSDEMSNQPQQLAEEQSQNDSSTSDSSEEQNNEMEINPQQLGEEQSQSDSSTGDSSEEQSNEMSNQPQQPGEEKNQDGSSTSDSFEEPSDEMESQPQQPGGEQSQSDSSTSDSFEEQNNEMENQLQQSGSEQSQNNLITNKSLDEQGIELEKNNILNENEVSTDDPDERKYKLQQLRNLLLDYAKKKQEEENRSIEKSKLTGDKKEVTESKEEKYELSEQTNNFINQLNELPSFKNRDREVGYSIDTNGYTEIPDSVIRTLITKFLNQRFCKKISDLNVRSNSLEKAKGFYKWEVKDVIIHLKTHQITKVLTDKYGYQYAQGKNENVPLSFYFDMSGSMSAYTNMLAVMAIELLKKNVKVLIGFNERVNVQIESIKGNIDVETLSKILESAGYYSGWNRIGSRENFIKDSRVSYKYIDKNIDNYLIDKKAEKCVVFADFDPKEEVENLSQKAQVYWFCFEKDYNNSDLNDYRGFIYPVQNVRDIVEGLIKVNDKRFETLCYTDNPKTLQRKIGG